MTKLAAYLDSTVPKITQSEFGNLVGADQSTVSQWCSGDRRPGIGHALAIDRVTCGKVPIEYWTTVRTSVAAPKTRPRKRKAG